MVFVRLMLLAIVAAAINVTNAAATKTQRPTTQLPSAYRGIYEANI